MSRLSSLVISTDNALGSKSGDVDDGLALLHLLGRALPIHKVITTYGNTSEAESFKNTVRLLKLMSAPLSPTRGATRPNDVDFSYELLATDHRLDTEHAVQLLELGPLTTLAQTLKSSPNFAACVERVLVVGTNLTTVGRWPPFWPFEYNLSKDFAATKTVFESQLPITIFPLDVIRKLRLSLESLQLGDQLSTNWLKLQVQRWFSRTKRLYFKNTIIAWDVVPAVFLSNPEFFTVEERFVTLSNRMVRYSDFGKAVNVVTHFDVEGCKMQFLSSLRGIRLNTEFDLADDFRSDSHA